jgi:transcriptional regulator NrdR family protein
MGLSVDVVKQGGGRRAIESFKREKLHRSIVAACLSVQAPIGQAESIANAVCDSVVGWVQDKPEITSRDIRITVAKHLHAHHPDAAYMYEQYLVVM